MYDFRGSLFTDTIITVWIYINIACRWFSLHFMLINNNHNTVLHWGVEARLNDRIAYILFFLALLFIEWESNKKHNFLFPILLILVRRPIGTAGKWQWINLLKNYWLDAFSSASCMISPQGTFCTMCQTATWKQTKSLQLTVQGKIKGSVWIVNKGWSN